MNQLGNYVFFKAKVYQTKVKKVKESKRRKFTAYCFVTYTITAAALF